MLEVVVVVVIDGILVEATLLLLCQGGRSANYGTNSCARGSTAMCAYYDVLYEATLLT